MPESPTRAAWSARAWRRLWTAPARPYRDVAILAVAGALVAVTLVGLGTWVGQWPGAMPGFPPSVLPLVWWAAALCALAATALHVVAPRPPRRLGR